MLTSTERKIVENIRADEIERVVIEAAKIPSFSPPNGHEQELAEFFADELRSSGVEVELQEVRPSRPNVIARLKARRTGPSVLFNGHTDTSPPVLGWTVDPHGGVREEDKLYGHGVSNMKGSDTAMIGAIAALQRSGVTLLGDVTVSLVMGECRGGQGTLHMLAEGLRADYFINGEPTDLKVLTLTAGTCHLKIIVRGRAHHFSIPGKGVNAIEKMMTVLQVLGESNTPMTTGSWLRLGSEKPEYAGFPRFNLGVIKGGLTEDCLDSGPQNTPDYCVATLDVRYTRGLSPDLIRAALERAVEQVAKADKDLIARVELATEVQMPPYEASPDDFVVSAIRDASADILGHAPEVGAIAPLKFMGADAGHLQAAGIPGVICGVGTFAGNIPGEYVEISKVIELAKIYAVTAYRVSGPQG
jgi:acetylornithine deacetylase